MDRPSKLPSRPSVKIALAVIGLLAAAAPGITGLFQAGDDADRAYKILLQKTDYQDREIDALAAQVRSLQLMLEIAFAVDGDPLLSHDPRGRSRARPSKGEPSKRKRRKNKDRLDELKRQRPRMPQAL
jgi:hypothetical protein